MTSRRPTAIEEALTIDWAKIESFDHEYHEPHMLGYFESLAADDKGEALRGYRALNDECLWKPDAFCPAGVKAFPLLLRMGIEDEVRYRHLPLKLSANILAGGYLRHDHVGLDFAEPAVRKRYSRGRAREVYRHALDCYGAIAALLDDKDDNIKAHGALLLALLWHQRWSSVERLANRVGSADDKEARGAMLTALGLLLRYGRDPASTDATLKPLERAAVTEFERALAHAARYLTPGAAFAPDAGDLLSPLILAGDGSNAPYMWYDGYFPDAALAGLLLQGEEGLRVGQAMLLKLLRGGPREAWNDATHEYLRLCFGDRRKIATKERQSLSLNEPLHRLKGPFGPDDFDTSERRSLEMIADLPLDSLHFPRFGLPTRAADRRRLLGLEPAGVLEAPVELEGESMLLWQALGRLVTSARDVGVRDEAFLMPRFGHEPVKLAEIEAERALGAYGLAGGSYASLGAAFERAGASMAPYARRVFNECERAGGRVADASLVRLLLRAILLAEGELPPRYHPFVTLYPSLVPLAEVRHGGEPGDYTPPILVAVELFAALPPARRRTLLSARLESNDEGAPPDGRTVVTYDVHTTGHYLRHCPDSEVVASMLELLESERVRAELECGDRWRRREPLPDDGVIPSQIDEATLRADLATQLEPLVASLPEVASVVATYEARRGRPLREI